MKSVQANDALELSLLEGCDTSVEQLGDVILQEGFQVWDQKKLIRQSRDRRMFLFELYLVFSKEVKDSSGKTKYQYKMKMMVSSSKMQKNCSESDRLLFYFRRATWESRSMSRAMSVNLQSGQAEPRRRNPK